MGINICILNYLHSICNNRTLQAGFRWQYRWKIIHQIVDKTRRFCAFRMNDMCVWCAREVRQHLLLNQYQKRVIYKFWSMSILNVSVSETNVLNYLAGMQWIKEFTLYYTFPIWNKHPCLSCHWNDLFPPNFEEV